MAPIHDRMPIVLGPADWSVWLGEEEGDPRALLRPADDTVLRTWPVGADVNSVRHNGAGLLQPISEESIVGVLTRRKIDPKANGWLADGQLPGWQCAKPDIHFRAGLAESGPGAIKDQMHGSRHHK